MTRRWLAVLSEIAVLTVLTLWSGWGVLHNPFHFDDALFLQSAQVTEPRGPFFLLQPAQSRQLTYLTFYWNYQAGQANPFGYHLVNLLLHLANVLGVYLFASLLIAKAPDAPSGRTWLWIPLTSAALFAVHPIQSEAVNYAYQRSTLLAGFFSLLSMNAWLLCRRAGRPWLLRAVAVTAFVLAVASKESALVLPGIWALCVWIHADDWRSFRAWLFASWRAWVPLAVAITVGLAWLLSNLRSTGEQTIGLPLTYESLRYLLCQAQVFATYLRMLVWPAGLSVDHDFRAAPLLSLYSILCIGLVAGILAVLLRFRRVSPTPCFLAGSFLILLAPTSSVVPSADLLFEHRLYLPMIAGSVLLAWGGVILVLYGTSFGRLRRVVWIACVVLVVGTCAFMFRQRSRIWGDNVRLWEDAVSKAPWNARAHYNLGVSLVGTDPERARDAFLEAVELKPRYAAALYNLGWLAQKAGRFEPAVEYYRRTLDADPLHWQAYQNLGNLSALRGSLRDALREYREVIRIRPDYWPAYQSLAGVQVQLGDFMEALSTLRTLQELNPDSLEARYLRAYVLAAEGETTEAEREIAFVAARDMDGAYRERLEELRIWMARR
jgi:Flp pilus assembly protein TadD